MAMMSDFTCGFLLLAKVEGVAVFPWYLSTPPPAANATIQYWKESGQWLPGVDETASQGFLGFAALFPMYLDIPYSHSVLGMAIVGLVVAIIAWLRYGIGFAYAMAIFFSAISHPVLDMFFHDAYVLAGNRAVSRVTVNFWQIYYMEPVAFLLECCLAYGGYRLWWSTRRPRASNDQVVEKIAYYKRLFWTISMSHNMASFYIVSPLAIFTMYKYFPAQQFATNDCYWGYAVFAFTMWSWTMALFPLHKLQELTIAATEKDVDEADEAYRKIP